MLEMFKSRAHKTRDRIMRYEALPSEPTDVGAVARQPKQSTPISEQPALVPEVHESKRESSKSKILRYLSQNQNKLISYKDIARGSGTAKSKIGKLIRELVEEQVIVHSVPRPRHGTTYQIIGQGPNLSKGAVQPSIPNGSEEEDIDYVNITSDLMWSFIRETRTTDVLLFLTWLEQKAGRV